MCGIFGYVGDHNNAAETVLDGLKTLEYRGYDSWGVAVEKQGILKLEKHTGKIGEAHSILPKSTMGFGHTRWATHGGVTELNAHPHVDCSGEIAVVHNGIVENYQELRQKLVKDHVFSSETDTEVLVHLVEDEMKHTKDFVQAVRTVFCEVTGLNALIAFYAKTHQFVAVKNGSPLILGFGQGENWIASDAQSLSRHTNTVMFLEDGEMAVITENSIDVFDLHGKKKELRKQTLDFKSEDTKKGNYPHFMIKEIHEQDKVLESILHRNDEISQMAGKIEDKQLIFSGCGTANYISLVGKYFFEEFAKKRVEAIQGNEFSVVQDLIDSQTFPLFITQSGETIDIVQPMKMLKKEGKKFGVLVNALGSTAYRIADEKFLLGAGPEIAVGSTKVVSSMLATLLLLSGIIGKRKSETEQLLKDAIQSVKEVFKDTYTQTYLSPLAKKFIDQNDLYIIGRGVLYPVALEMALKFKEISYVHAEGFAAGELKHGMIALIQKGTPCIVLAGVHDGYQETISNAMEIKARGGWIIGISEKNNEAFDDWIPVKDVGIANAIPFIVLAQLLSYYIGVYKGNDVDKPRNLAKSVTVK